MSLCRFYTRHCARLMGAEPVSISTRRDPSVSLKQCAKKRNILVAHRIADLLHAAMVAFQHPLGRRDTQFLQVGQGLSPVACLNRRTKFRMLMPTRRAGSSSGNVLAKFLCIHS